MGKKLFFQTPGRVLSYKSEADLFADYKSLVKIQETSTAELKFAAWRGLIDKGGIMRHPGHLKINGIQAEYVAKALELVTSAVRDLFGSRRVHESPVEIYPEIRNKQAIRHKFWANIYFFSADLAEAFATHLRAKHPFLGISGDAFTHCMICQRKSHNAEQCKALGIRIKFTQSVNHHLLQVMRDNLGIREEDIVVGHNNQGDPKDFAYLWLDSEEARAAMEDKLFEFGSSMGIISGTPTLCNEVLKECHFCGHVSGENDPHTGRNCLKSPSKRRQAPPSVQAPSLPSPSPSAPSAKPSTPPVQLAKRTSQAAGQKTIPRPPAPFQEARPGKKGRKGGKYRPKIPNSAVKEAQEWNRLDPPKPTRTTKEKKQNKKKPRKDNTKAPPSVSSNRFEALREEKMEEDVVVPSTPPSQETSPEVKAADRNPKAKRKAAPQSGSNRGRKLMEAAVNLQETSSTPISGKKAKQSKDDGKGK